MNELKNGLKRLRHGAINPREEWLTKNRDFLLSQIKNTVAPREEEKFNLDKVWLAMSILLPRNFVYGVVRPLAVVFLIFVVGSSGWIATVAASQDSLPGEWLYPAKRVTEKTQVAAATVVGDKKTETNLRVEFAKRRAVETKKLVVSQEPEKIKKAPRVVEDLKQEIKQVNANLEEIKKESTASNNVSAEAVKNINKETEQIKTILQEVKTGLIAASSSEKNTLLADNVAQAKGLAKETAIKAVEVLVGKHLQGDNTVTNEDVKEAINNQVKSVQAEVVVNKIDMAKVEKAVEAAVKKEDQQQSKDSKTNVESKIDDKLTKIEEVAKQTKEAVTKVQEVAQSVDKKTTETENLLSKNDLAQAVKVVREASEATNTVEKVAGETMKALQTAAPAVIAKIVGMSVPTTTVTGTVDDVAKINTSTVSSSTSGIKTATTTAIEAKKVEVKNN